MHSRLILKHDIISLKILYSFVRPFRGRGEPTPRPRSLTQSPGSRAAPALAHGRRRCASHAAKLEML
jgi:hypothetical protein